MKRIPTVKQLIEHFKKPNKYVEPLTISDAVCCAEYYAKGMMAAYSNMIDATNTDFEREYYTWLSRLNELREL